MTRFFYYGRKAAAVPDLREYMDIGIPACVDFVVSPLFKEVRDEQTGQSKRVRQGTNSAILMDVKTWTNKIVGQISESMCLDCADDAARLRNEDMFKEELEWAYYLGVPSVFGPELSKGSNSNYAGIVSAFISRKFNSPVR
ncbi:hypothetical protein WA577_007250, partial [Blastocystis sp. JDR]